jgi:hypothetical protein
LRAKLVKALISQLSANPTLTACSIARRLTAGMAPGRPVQTGQMAVLASVAVVSTTAQPQNILDAVRSSAWIFLS